MPFIILSVILQVLFVIHVVKTGRNTTWIWIIVTLPLAGSIAYFILEVLPDIAATKTGRAAKRKVSDALNPDRDINAAASSYAANDSVQNAVHLANECLKKELYDEAKELFQKCLTGVHEHDPDLMHGLAASEYGLENYEEVKAILDRLIEENPEYRNQEAHLLYAKALDNMGDEKKAMEEFEILHSYYSGPEPTFHLAMLYRKRGDDAKSQELLKGIIQRADMSGGHYDSLHKEWIKKAKNEYSG